MRFSNANPTEKKRKGNETLIYLKRIDLSNQLKIYYPKEVRFSFFDSPVGAIWVEGNPKFYDRLSLPYLYGLRMRTSFWKIPGHSNTRSTRKWVTYRVPLNIYYSLRFPIRPFWAPSFIQCSLSFGHLKTAVCSFGNFLPQMQKTEGFISFSRCTHFLEHEIDMQWGILRKTWCSSHLKYR